MRSEKVVLDIGDQGLTQNGGLNGLQYGVTFLTYIYKEM